MGKRERKNYISLKNPIQSPTLDVKENPNNNFSISTQQLGLFQYSSTVADVGVCHINLNTKNIQLSDKLYEIIGHKSGSFIPTLRNLSRFIYYEDKASFYSLLRQNKENKPNKIKRLRLVTKNGQIKHVDFKYQMILENNENIIILGFTDNTSEINKSEILAHENEKLKKDNSQLLTFNQIAGHDLQEPIRKIQMFVSRIKESSENPIPENIFEYLKKIEETSARMQKLIKDLLAFTHISNIENSFEKVALQEIMDEALKEVVNEEQNLKINIDPLPTATVIPFQIKQLFINLISNSLKFTDNEKPVNITIKNITADESDLKNFPNLQPQDLIKISIEDDGIGFDNKFAEEIFNSFTRLHNKNLFSGSGLGLAICKKVMDNHNGIINAYGRPNAGATFVFVFPVTPN